MSSPPPKYNRAYDFVAFQTANPSTPLPASNVHIELAAIKATTDQTIDRLAEIQRDDGKLANLTVGVDQLDSSTLALLAGSVVVKGAWVTATAYKALDLVSVNGASYICAVDHTSAAAFDTDLTAARWLLFANPTAANNAAFFQQFSGTGSQTVFTLSASQGTDPKNIFVFVGGAIRRPAIDYTLSGVTLTFTAAPASGTNNVLVFGAANAVASSVADAASNAAAAIAAANAAAASEAAVAASAATATTQAGIAETEADAAALSAAQAAASAASITLPIPLSGGGTGGTDAATARAGLGLGALAIKTTAATADINDGAMTARKESDDAWSSIASAATVDLGGINSRNALITGTTGITSFGNTGGEGRTIRVRFGGILTLTNSAGLILPTAANIVAAVGDTAIFVKEAAASTWRCVEYMRADGQAVAGASGPTITALTNTTSGTSIDISGFAASLRRFSMNLNGVSTNGLSTVRVQLGRAGPTFETSGYVGSMGYVGSSGGPINSSSGFDIDDFGGAGAVRHGRLVFEMVDLATNTWSVMGIIVTPATAQIPRTFAGTKSLAGAFDRIRLTTAGGTDAFDAGSISFVLG